MTRTKSSRRWLKEHFSDPFVKQAQQEGYRSRAVYKLLALQEKDQLFKPGMVVVDLGAAPGGWAQLAIKLVGSTGRVIALDILPMDTIPGVEFIQGDFREEEILQKLLQRLNDKVDIVMSDMLPNLSGMAAIDQPRIMYLAELALSFSKKILQPGGTFLTKIFQGEGFSEYLVELRHLFEKVVVRKPDASRSRSAEIYLLARGYRNSI